MSSITFDWVAEGAQSAGLDLREDLLQETRGERVAVAPLHHRLRRGGVTGLLLRAVIYCFSADRTGPKSVGEVSDWVRWRTIEDPDYRPKTLARVMDDLID